MREPIIKTVTLPCPAERASERASERAFDIFVGMPSWWPLEKRSMSLMRAGGPAKSLSVEAREGGRIAETAADVAEWH